MEEKNEKMKENMRETENTLDLFTFFFFKNENKVLIESCVLNFENSISPTNVF